jgi:Lipase (class 3)
VVVAFQSAQEEDPEADGSTVCCSCVAAGFPTDLPCNTPRADDNASDPGAPSTPRPKQRWLQAWLSVRKSVVGIVLKCIAADARWKVYCVGHSAGGALATIASLDLANDRCIQHSPPHTSVLNRKTSALLSKAQLPKPNLQNPNVPKRNLSNPTCRNPSGTLLPIPESHPCTSCM